MSKAEESAMQHCCTNCTNNKLNCGMKLISHGRNCIKCSNYIEGYHQAEKDLELGWEDIMDILKIYDTFTYKKEWVECKTLADGYQEILKRFKERKEKCQ